MTNLRHFVDVCVHVVLILETPKKRNNIARD